MVDWVAGKIGVLENRLTQLEGDAGGPCGGDVGDPLPLRFDIDEPRFTQPKGLGATPKSKKTCMITSDLEMVESVTAVVRKRNGQRRNWGIPSK